MKIVLIGDTDTVTAFGLAGVEGREVYPTTGEEPLKNILTEYIENSGIGIIMITKTFAYRIKDFIDSHITGGKNPLIVQIPDMLTLDDDISILKLIREAIGIKV